MPPKVLVICGPTASGKTALAVALAKAHNGEVVSADSMQIYRTMDIGTAKPTAEEMEDVPHHMLDVADPEEDFSVARYVEMAAACVDDILARGKLPIIAGGTGLYIDSLLSGRTFAAFSPDSPLRKRLERRYVTQGGSALLAELDRNCAREWSLESMAAFVRMSQSSFRQQFRLMTGTAPITYLLRLRLQKAASLLRLSGRIGDVAMRVGFQDTNYFTRQFHAFYGCSPREYKRQYKN